MPRTFHAGDITLHQRRENVWEMPESGDMRVPARVLASESLLEEISGDKTLQQLRNTTELPGIQTPAICMPDGHQGYGFPVGGVAAIDAENGCISPGGVGYDINCVSGDTTITLEFGRHCRIDDLRSTFESERAVVIDDGTTHSQIRLFTETAEAEAYQLRTETGDTVRATSDHPFLTPDGMVELGDLEPGEMVCLHPFEGLPDEDPAARVVLDRDDFDEEPAAVRTALQERDLLPLTTTDAAFHRLLKLVGYHTGAGTFSGTEAWFFGTQEDLERVAADVEHLGFDTASIDRTADDQSDPTPRNSPGEYRLRVPSTAFQALLRQMGAPENPTADSDFTTPSYLDSLVGWQQALYLSAFFGAEMCPPRRSTQEAIGQPAVTHVRSSDHADAGEEFLRELGVILEDLDIEATHTRSEGSGGEPVRFRLELETDEDNLIRFCTRVGYRYATAKQRAGLLVAQYLKYARAGNDRVPPRPEADPTLTDGGTAVGSRDTATAPADVRPTFEEFATRRPVQKSGAIGTTIVSVDPVGTEPVYDIGVAHDAHNFVADGFVVSNCGVRMVRTSLSYEDVAGREEELVNKLFEAIPSGLGGGGVLERNVSTVDAILDRGMDWAEEHGFAVPDDLRHCEDEGRRPESDPDDVSREAKERGATQIGSLGSGNHFLEVQRVTDIYREDVAERFGLSPDQIVVLIHCGSRGLGHQVCTDYLREIEQRHGDLLAELPDRELAAAPAGSELAEEYYRAMCAAINFAWVNRQLITFRTREVFEDVFGADWDSLGMDLLYDVAHNIAKREVHEIDGEDRELFVHRKGATRAFPAGRPEVPAAYREVGQPVIIPGSMGAGSYVLRGGQESLSVSFGSTAHGAGRLMSRTQAKNEYWGGDVQDQLRDQQHVYVKAQSGATIAEEAPGVYKDVDEVVRVSDALGIGDRVARTFPVCNIKG